MYESGAQHGPMPPGSLVEAAGEAYLARQGRLRSVRRSLHTSDACLVHVWSTRHRSRAVRNGLQRSPAVGHSRRLQARSCGNRPGRRTLIRMSYALSTGVESSSGRGGISRHRQPSPAPQGGGIGWCGRCGWHGRPAGARHGVDGRWGGGGRVRPGG
jgi:hypothetical protein